jgi:hypothetical protein
VGFQNSAALVDLGFLRGPLILVEEAAEHGSALDPHLGEVSDRVIGYGWVELAPNNADERTARKSGASAGLGLSAGGRLVAVIW